LTDTALDEQRKANKAKMSPWGN